MHYFKLFFPVVMAATTIATAGPDHLYAREADAYAAAYADAYANARNEFHGSLQQRSALSRVSTFLREKLRGYKLANYDKATTNGELSKKIWRKRWQQPPSLQGEERTK
jgi:hypothetical protein